MARSVATLTRLDDGARAWAGELAVSFPGATAVPLTGSEFKTRLARSFP